MTGTTELSSSEALTSSSEPTVFFADLKQQSKSLSNFDGLVDIKSEDWVKTISFGL